MLYLYNGDIKPLLILISEIHNKFLIYKEIQIVMKTVINFIVKLKTVRII